MPRLTSWRPGASGSAPCWFSCRATSAIRRKTGALMATSCRLGGVLSDAQPEHADVLERFGEALGLGFQLSDDIMDVISSERELGKEPAVDLRLGVYTLPVLHTIHHGER